MDSFLIVISFLLEFIFLSYFEYKIWKSFFTPFFVLAIPFFFVTLITVLISDNVGFVQFYYPTLFIWHVGLAVFAIPSFVIGLSCQDVVVQSTGSLLQKRYDENGSHLYLVYIAYVLMLLLMFRFVTFFRSSTYMIGSDEFAKDLCGKGIWAHVRQAAMAMLAMLIFYYRKKAWYFLLPLIVFILFALIYQVKGWIIIAVLTGVLGRLFVGVSTLKISLLLKSVLGAFVLFQIVYTLSFVVAGKSELGWEVFNYISMHFLHYFTSGVLGLSVDIQRDCPDRQTWEILFTPFMNIIYSLTGHELLTPINPVYYNTGINLTNVRTFFGTIYILTNKFQFIIISMGISAFIYAFRVFMQKSLSISMLLIYCFLCSLTAMGWFEYYYHHLETIEIPILYIIFQYIDKSEKKRKLLNVPEEV